MTDKLVVKNPYSAAVLSELHFATPQESAKAIERAKAAFTQWKNTPAWQRTETLLAVAQDLETRKQEFAQTLCAEAGKPITLSLVEIDRGISVLRWAAGEISRFSGELLRLDAARTGRAGFGLHTRFPRGVILGITPFNFPLNLVMHKVAPAVASGCAILIKPSPATPLTALKLAEAFDKALPKNCQGLVQVILADDRLTEDLTRSSDIAMVSFTGSARVGKLIQQQAYDKPVTLELGGNAWCIIMEDVPASAYPAIAKKISGGAYGYAGQTCISVQNVAVASSAWNDVRSQLSQATQAFAFGEPTVSEVLSGPVINEGAAKRIRGELAKASSAHAEIIRSSKIHGNVADGSANMIAPSLILAPESVTTLSGDMRSLQREEIFAPVMMAGKFDRIDDLIQTMNSSAYGLQAGVFTQNLSVIEKLYKELEVGGLIINDVPTTRYDHQPYGGVKDSGHGREGVRYAMEEMTYSKFLALSGLYPS
jgi:acyl-CoA reductase-like NAD-dependent aldehyde dehydrogenase